MNQATTILTRAGVVKALPPNAYGIDPAEFFLE